jgi:hypothetical protein
VRKSVKHLALNKVIRAFFPFPAFTLTVILSESIVVGFKFSSPCRNRHCPKLQPERNQQNNAFERKRVLAPILSTPIACGVCSHAPLHDSCFQKQTQGTEPRQGVFWNGIVGGFEDRLGRNCRENWA